MRNHLLAASLILVPVLCDVGLTRRSFLRRKASTPHELTADTARNLSRWSLLEKPGGGLARGDDEEGEAQDDAAWKKESRGTRWIRHKIEHVAPWFTKERRMKFYEFVGWCIILGYLCKLSYMFVNLFLSYRDVCSKGSPEEASQKKFGNYLLYRFSYWFVWTQGSRGVVLLFVTSTVLFTGAFLYKFFTGSPILSSTWSSFVWLVAPDAGAGESTIAGAFIGAFMSICGLVIFALLLTLLQDGFASYLESQGNASIIDGDHTILIGLTDQTMPIVQELCTAHECHGGTTIAILSEQISKEEMEAKIQEAEIDFLGSRVVVRTGNAADRSDLKQIAADAARTIVVMADRAKAKEQRDAFAVQVLVALRSEGWPVEGKIVAVCSLVRNFSLLERIGGVNTEVVLLDRFTAKLMVQCSAQQGIARAVGSTLGFEGSELYVKSVPSQIKGLTFSEAAWFYPNAVLAGYVSVVDGKSEATFCPPKDFAMSGAKEIMLLAEDDNSADPKEKPMEPVQPPLLDEAEAAGAMTPRGHWRRSGSLTKAASTAPEIIVVIGWNDVMSFMLSELDVAVPPSSSLYVLAPKPKEEREEYLEVTMRRNKEELSNITSVEQIEGVLGSRMALDELQVIQQATRIFILSDESAENPAEADTCTIACILQIRDIYAENQQVANIPIIPEIMNPKIAAQCAAIRSFDFMNASRMPAQILAMIAFEPKVAPGLERFLSEDGNVSFQIETISTYCQGHSILPDKMSFFEASAMVACSSKDVLIGWSIPREETEAVLNQAAGGNKGEFHQMMAEWCQTVHPALTNIEWELNPSDKSASRTWTRHDRFLVLTSGRGNDDEDFVPFRHVYSA